ncbi:peptidoglycan/xylan/chitin deacetylase (PgdA/CDA1 family) [Rhizomicrobium palustre]|uniref:Chitooligosaccharide deacetylase n=1 Tax=Rhizomicrobium palustre TaxID=189966 RepID=A0A846N331_9PROT|nr:polysaccharide deacetylase family protein [Rhizomicrobium palustre]NIK90368.1 peptidoglycan/xylan/chitin deacetylase (PgdA/CDA1 family) [Rhizomicrobium palustre]
MNTCLMLHGVGPLPAHIEADEAPYWISAETFTMLLPLVKKHSARLTFDDGNESDFTLAFPALRAAGLKASFFVLSDRIGRDAYLSEDHIRTMHQGGMEIGTHGAAHLNWTKHSDAEITRDVSASIERLSDIIGARVTSLAIPFGHCNRRVLAVLRHLGLSRIYTSFRGPDSDKGWMVRRDCVMADFTPADIEALLTCPPAPHISAIRWLKIWRRAGNAFLRTA